jgi:hypothetical protein
MKEVVQELRDALANVVKPLRLDDILRGADDVEVAARLNSETLEELLPRVREAVQGALAVREVLLRADRLLAVWPDGSQSISGVQAASNDQLLAELQRRGALEELHGAIGALYDNLEHNGSLDADSPTTAYLAFRLRREEARITLVPDREARIANWQQCIDDLGGSWQVERNPG